MFVIICGSSGAWLARLTTKPEMEEYGSNFEVLGAEFDLVTVCAHA